MNMTRNEEKLKSPTQGIAKWKRQKFAAPGLAAAVLVTLISVAGCSGKQSESTSASATAQPTYATPAEAGQALKAAAQASDENTLSQILGPSSKPVFNSGNPAEDKTDRESFVAKYDQMNRWVAMKDGSQVLNIGADNYPFPIPLVRDTSSKWHFSGKDGEAEILFRRIGANELMAIDACKSIGDAQAAYVTAAHDGNPAHLYAALIVSTPGKQDGLYWDAPEGQNASPLAGLSEFAASELAAAASGGPLVIDGYSYRILTAQGDKAKGGAKSYLVNGKLSGGFAVIASPAKYGDTGIMTFVMGRDGVVYEKDLGASTADAAAAIKEYNPTDDWVAVD